MNCKYYIYLCSLVNDEFEFFANGFWNILVAITTVGYGDFYAQTHIGRAVTVIAVFNGTIMISLTVVSLTNIFNFSENEQKSSDILNKLDKRKELNHICQQIIYLSFKIKEIKDKKEKRTIDDDDDFCKFSKLLFINKRKAFNLRQEIKEFSFASDIDKIDDLSEKLNKLLDKINDNLAPINNLKRKIKFQTQKMRKLQINIEECLILVRLK